MRKWTVFQNTVTYFLLGIDAHINADKHSDVAQSDFLTHMLDIYGITFVALIYIS